ncbi:hypothetical protein ACXR2U_17965 [Jatrophihabitans sp. YIM 134969]
MTVTQDSSDRARSDARRAARAVRLARGQAAAPPAPVDDDPLDTPPADLAPPTAVALTKPATVEEPDDVGDVELPVTGSDDTAAGDADADDTSADGDEADDAGDADDDGADDQGGAPTRARRRPRRATVLATAFALLAVVFVVVAAVVHANAQDDRTTSPAAARDAALLAARQEIVVLNTLDYRDVDGGLQRWLGATTGTLHDQLATVSDADKAAIAQSKSVTTASVLAAAVTQVDPANGGATVITSIQIDVRPATGQATSKRNRFSLTMTRVGDVWKIGAVQQVPVNVT